MSMTSHVDGPNPGLPEPKVCFHPEHEESLGLHRDLNHFDERELELLRAEVVVPDPGLPDNGHPCFHPEHEESLGLHRDLTPIDERELEFLRVEAVAPR